MGDQRSESAIKIADWRLKIRDRVSGTADLGSGIRGLRFGESRLFGDWGSSGIGDRWGTENKDQTSEIGDRRSLAGIGDRGSWIWDLGSGIGNRGSGIWDLKSGIGGRKSGTGDRGSGIKTTRQTSTRLTMQHLVH